MSKFEKRLKQMVVQFNEYVDNHNIEEPGPTDLIKFLHMQNFSDSEIEDVFEYMGYPLNMDNIDRLEKDDDIETQKQESINAIINGIEKNMNKDMKMVLADILGDHASHQGAEEKPRARQNPETGEWELVTEDLKECYQAYLFESNSTIVENYVTKSDAKRILDIAYDTGKAKMSRSNIYNLWRNSYSESTDILDLNDLLKDVGLRFYAANRIANKHNIPRIKDYQLEYVENVARITIKYDVVVPILQYLNEKHKIKLKEENAAMQILKGAAMYDVQRDQQEDMQKNHQQAVSWFKEWVQKVGTLQNQSQHEQHLVSLVNMLASIYGSPSWEPIKNNAIKAISNLQVDRNTMEKAIRDIDSGQEMQAVTESTIKKIFAELLVNEDRKYYN